MKGNISAIQLVILVLLLITIASILYNEGYVQGQMDANKGKWRPGIKSVR